MPVASAEGLEWLRYIGAVATYTVPDDDRGSDIANGTGLSLLYGQRTEEDGERGFGWEAGVFGSLYETGDDGATDYYRWGVGADATYTFEPIKGLRPFVLAGPGYGQNDVYPNRRDDADWFVNVGGGFVTKSFLSRFIRIRGELRYIYDNYGDGLGDWRGGLGLEFALAVREPEPLPVHERVRVVALSTGLHDDDDDGIVNERDRCPQTPRGVRVDGTGCPLQKVTRLHGVTFEFDSDRLRPDARTILGDVAETLKRYPEMVVEIAGHTDNSGSDEYNQGLSKRRAQSVQKHLYEQGVATGQVQAAGYGETEPVETNETLEGRELNRRVEMRVLK